MYCYAAFPLTAVRVGKPQTGRSAWYLVEFVEGVDYVSFAHFSEAVFRSKTPSQPIGMGKNEVKALLGLARSDRERELVRYSIFKTSGLTSTGARQKYGFERMYERTKHVEECLEAAFSIREAINKISQVQNKAIVNAMGLVYSDSSESDTDDSEIESILSPPLQLESNDTTLPSYDTLKKVLEDGQYNWFMVVDVLEQSVHCEDSVMESILKKFYSYMLDLQINPQQKNLLSTSYEAHHISMQDADQCRIAASLNGDIVSDSESDNPEDYVGLTSVTSEGARQIITRKRKAIARRARRINKRVKMLVDRFPDIGETIESYVSEANIGADAWRKTGVLTFDGNLKVKQVTYGCIQQHLQDKYDYKFSYETVVQMCVARNKHR